MLLLHTSFLVFFRWDASFIRLSVLLCPLSNLWFIGHNTTLGYVGGKDKTTRDCKGSTTWWARTQKTIHLYWCTHALSKNKVSRVKCRKSAELPPLPLWKTKISCRLSSPRKLGVRRQGAICSYFPPSWRTHPPILLLYSVTLNCAFIFYHFVLATM